MSEHVFLKRDKLVNGKETWTGWKYCRSMSKTTITLSTGSAPGWVLSPLYVLYTHAVLLSTPPLTALWSADDTLVWLVPVGDESAYREEVCAHSRCCRGNQTLGIIKTKEGILDFRSHEDNLFVLHINMKEVEVCYVRIPKNRLIEPLLICKYNCSN